MMRTLLRLIKLFIIFSALRGQNCLVHVLFPPGTLFPTIVVFGPVGFKEAARDFLFSINCLTKAFLWEIYEGKSESGSVGLFALPCSFRSPFVDSTCSLYGSPVQAAIQLLFVN